MSKKHTIFIITTFIIIFNITVFKFPKEIIQSSNIGLQVWYKNLVPSLLPFIFVNNLARETGVFHFLGNLICSPISKLLRISNISTISYIASLFSGYPIGSKLIYDNFENGDISKDEGVAVAMFSNIASPLFILGTVGATLFKNAELGLYLLTVQICTSLILGILTSYSHKNFYTPKRKAIETKGFVSALSFSINNSITTITVIGCYVVILSVVTKMFTILGVLNILSKLLTFMLAPFGLTVAHSTSIIIGLFEMTSGVVYLSNNESINIVTASTISFILAFGGLSINSQCISFLSKVNINTTKFLSFKLIQALLAYILTFCTYNILF